ncbi:unnamed protein product [Urochloa humidicola]
MAASVVDAEYLRQVDRARRQLRALISNKGCAPIMLRLAFWILVVVLLTALGCGLRPSMVLLSEIVQTFILADFCYYYVKSVFGGRLVLRLPSGWFKTAAASRVESILSGVHHTMLCAPSAQTFSIVNWIAEPCSLYFSFSPVNRLRETFTNYRET